jgi:hypothetical protein
MKNFSFGQGERGVYVIWSYRSDSDTWSLMCLKVVFVPTANQYELYVTLLDLPQPANDIQINIDQFTRACLHYCRVPLSSWNPIDSLWDPILTANWISWCNGLAFMQSLSLMAGSEQWVSWFSSVSPREWLDHVHSLPSATLITSHYFDPVIHNIYSWNRITE